MYLYSVFCFLGSGIQLEQYNMNKSTQVLEYLSGDSAPNILILAPHAPPVTRKGNQLQVALNTVFSADDVSDTLMALASLAQTPDQESAAAAGVYSLTALRSLEPSPNQSLPESSGAFSFGIRDVGRFRVTYGSQRGTRIVYVARIPFVVPDLDSLLDDSAAIKRLVQMTASMHGGILPVFGPSDSDNNTLVYALLSKLNRTERRILYILERSLTFLMRHENSIVFQTELNSDVKTLEEGVQNVLFFDPDIMYVADVRPSDNLPSVTHLAETNALVILTSSAMNGKMLLERFQPDFRGSDCSSSRANGQMIEVLGAGGGKLSINIFDNAPEA